MFRSAMFKGICGAVLCLSLGACSTLVRGTSQPVSLSTPGASAATCHLQGGDHVGLQVHTPATVQLPKSRKAIDVTCDAPGQMQARAKLKSSYSDLSIIEAPIGYPVDALSGAMWVYPKTFAVPFGATVARSGQGAS